SRVAATQSGSTGTPFGESAVNATRSLPGSRSTASMKGADGEGAQYGSPVSYPESRSSPSALSRTVRVSTPSVAKPDTSSARCGPQDTRPREGFSPTSPRHDAGMRIEPPPSLPCAIDTMPAATPAALPPDEPPGVREVSHGLRAGPKRAGSLTGRIPSSGRLVLPTTIAP